MGHWRSNFSKKCSSVKGPLWTMASRMKYNAAIMPLMRKNGRKGLRCFKHCFAETHMKHGEVRNKPQWTCLCLLPARPVREQQGNGSVQTEGDTESRGW